MRSLLSPTLLAALFSTCAQANANTIQRCEDAAGHITFTSLGCSVEQASQAVSAHNALPGSVTPSLSPRSADRSSSTSRDIVVVGQRDDGCGNRLSADARRQAIINRRTPPGMSLKDVENLLGRPERISQRNGELRYSYPSKDGRSNLVSFDQNGCVKGK